MTQKKEEQTIEASLRLVQDSETGSRILSGKTKAFIRWFAISMSLFQLYTGFFGELPGYKQLSIHLAFAMVLCFVYFPWSKKSPRDRLTIPDTMLAVIGGAVALYVFANYDHWVNAQGDAAVYDILIGGTLLVPQGKVWTMAYHTNSTRVPATMATRVLVRFCSGISCLRFDLA